MTMYLSLATPEKRLGAYLLNCFFLFLPFGISLVLFTYLKEVGWDSAHPDLRLKVHLLMSLLLGVFYLVWCIYNCIWLYKDGQTLGKKIMKIRILRTDGERAGLGRLLFLRGGSTFFLGFIPFGTLVDHLMIFGENNQTLHDRVAETLVVEVDAEEE